MTPAKMSLFQMDLRPSSAAEKPTVAQSAKEEAGRFLEALQQAEARKPDAKPVEREEATAHPARDPAQQAKHVQNRRDLQETHEQDAQKAQELHEAQTTQETRPTREELQGGHKSRVRKKTDDGREGVFPGLTGGNTPPPCGAASVCMGTESRPVGFAILPTQPVEGMGPNTAGPFAGVGQQAALPGQMGSVTPQMPQKMVEAMTVKLLTATDATLSMRAAGAEEKQDFAFALRLMNAPANTSGAKPAAATQSTLSAYSPTFVEDLAGEAGRLRVISRPGMAEQVRITLTPQDLGTLDMRLTVDEQNQVHLMITTDSDATRDLLNRQLPQLREALARQNLGMGEVMVHVDDGRGNHTAQEWGFQGGGERQEFLHWRGGERFEGSPQGTDAMQRPLPAGPLPTGMGQGGGGGLSLIV